MFLYVNEEGLDPSFSLYIEMIQVSPSSNRLDKLITLTHYRFRTNTIIIICLLDAAMQNCYIILPGDVTACSHTVPLIAHHKNES